MGLNLLTWVHLTGNLYLMGVIAHLKVALSFFGRLTAMCIQQWPTFKDIECQNLFIMTYKKGYKDSDKNVGADVWHANCLHTVFHLTPTYRTQRIRSSWRHWEINRRWGYQTFPTTWNVLWCSSDMVVEDVTSEMGFLILLYQMEKFQNNRSQVNNFQG